MKETDYLNFKSTDMLSKTELKAFYSRDALYQSTMLASKLIKHFYFNQQTQQYHRVSNNLPMNIENMNEYIAMMSRKLVLESMTCQRMLRRNLFEKQIEYFLDLAPDIKMKLIINNPLHYFSETNDEDTDEENENEDDTDEEEDDEEEGGHKFYTLSHIKNRLKNAQYDNQTVQEILDSII